MSAARRSVALLGRSAVKLSEPVPTRFARQLVTAAPLLRERPNRLPPGYIRPHRRTRRAPGTNISQDAVSGFSTPASASSSSVAVPSDPQGVLTESHAAYDLLAHDALIVVRQIEMLNIFMGFEQANRYSIQTKEGEVVGFLAEEEISFTGMLSRQFLRTHRPFRAVIMDRNGQPILWIRRPFQFINSRIFVQASQGEGGRLVGEAQQQWHPWRRKYNVFQTRDEETYRQFAKIDSGLLAWDFWLRDKDDRLVASINRNFAGFGRELFTDTGQYVIRFDAAGTELQVPSGSDVTVQGQTLVLPEGDEAALTLDQRAMALATAVSIDFDYFSRHSGAGGMGLPFMLYGGGGSDLQTGQSDAGAVAGAAGAAGAGMAGGSPRSEDEQVYGRQPESGTPATGWAQEPQDWDQLAQNEMPGGFGDELMDDPYGEEQEVGGDSGGGWGDWGDFGGSS